MGLFVNGNHKIDTSVKCFSLPPVITCPNCSLCKKCCYAASPYRIYPWVREKWNDNYKITQDGLGFVDLVNKELAEHKGPVRIHVSGDFYRQFYVNMWTVIIDSNPQCQFYAYTKTFDIFNFKTMLGFQNINIINSMCPDGMPNFGPPIRVYFLQQEGYFVCPATRPKSTVICGRDCFHCHTKGNNRVVFHKHR